MTRVRVAVGLVLLFGVVLAACDADDATGPQEGTIVRFTFDGYPADTLRVLITDEATIAAARAYVAGEATANIPTGLIVRGAADWEPRYPFHFLPETVRLAEVTIELCDGAPMRSPAEVDAFFALAGEPNAESVRWCPWGARPIAVE